MFSQLNDRVRIGPFFSVNADRLFVSFSTHLLSSSRRPSLFNKWTSVQVENVAGRDKEVVLNMMADLAAETAVVMGYKTK